VNIKFSRDKLIERDFIFKLVHPAILKKIKDMNYIPDRAIINVV